MPIAGVGVNVATPVVVNKNVETNSESSVEKTEQKKDCSKLLYGSLTALALLGIGYVGYKSLKGNKPAGKGCDKIVDDLTYILDKKPEPVAQEVKDKADEIVKVVKDALDKVKKDAEELEGVPKYIRRPLMVKFENPIEKKNEKIVDDLIYILDKKPEPVAQEVKDKADEVVRVVKESLEKVKNDAEELEKVPEYIRRPLMTKVDIPTAPQVKAEEVVQEFGSFKKGLAYDKEGKLFNGTRELIGYENRKMETTYKNGKVVARIYYPTEKYDLLEVNRLYDESVEGLKMVDTGLVKRNLNHSVKFEVIEKETKFPEEIERIIPKAKFDKPFDAGFYSQFPSERNDVAITWIVNDDIRVFGTGLSERGPRKMSLHYKGSHIRDFIDTPLGNIKGFRNSKAQLSIHTNLLHPELKVRSLSELGTVSYKGRSLDDFAAYLTKRYRPDQVRK